MLQPQFGRKPGEEGAYGSLCIWIQELHSGILGATPQAGKRPGSGVPNGRKFELFETPEEWNDYLER